jgi:hypothetical protein
LPVKPLKAYACVVVVDEVVAVIRRVVNCLRERRAARRARKLETLQRRAREGYHPPMGWGGS